MNKKFEINLTKTKGGCQSGRKVVTHKSMSNLPIHKTNSDFFLCMKLEKNWFIHIQFQKNISIFSYTYGQPPTSCYSYGGPSAASAPPPLKSNMYGLRPSSSSVAPNSSSWPGNALVRGPTPQAVRQGKSQPTTVLFFNS